MSAPAPRDAADLLRPARVVTVAGVHVVVPVDHDAPERVRARRDAHERERTHGPAFRQLHADIAAGLRVWRDRDGLPLTEDMIRERTNNLVASLMGNYTVLELQTRMNVFAEEDIR